VAAPGEGTPIDREKLRSIGYLSRGRTRPRVRETREQDGARTKAVTDELNNTVTEHTRRGTGVSHQQDVMIRPDTVHLDAGFNPKE
jgi:hypothetical protein